MKFNIIKSALLLLNIIFCNLLTAQVTSITYNSGSGLSTSKCNVFNPPVAVNGCTHTSVIGGPSFTGSALDLSTDYTFSTGHTNRTTYAISYPFKQGYSYAISISAYGSTSNGSAYPSLGATTLTYLPYTSTACGASDQSGFPQLGAMFIRQLTATNTTYSNMQNLNFVSAYNYSYLLLEATCVAAQDITDHVYITNVTITQTPPANLTPVISSAATATGVTGTAFSYTITASNSPTSYSATGLPAGLSVNTSTGVISGTPTIAGTYNVTLGATNASGTGTKALTLTINTNPCSTVPTFGVSQCVTPGSTVPITITNYPGAGTYTLSYVSGSAILNLSPSTFTPSSGIINVPVNAGATAGSTGNYNIVYNNASCGSSSAASLAISVPPASGTMSISGVTTCQVVLGYTLLTVSPSLCSTCNYNWSVAPGGGSIVPVSANTARFYTNGQPATVTASYCTTSQSVNVTAAPPRPTLDQPKYCFTGSSFNITVTNYPGVGNYVLDYVNVGQAGFSDFLVTGTLTPNASGVLTVLTNGTATSTSTGYYRLRYNDPVCGIITAGGYDAQFTVGAVPSSVSISGATTCQVPSGYTTLTASPALCANCTYNWAITSGAGSLSATSGNPVRYYTNGYNADVTATYVPASGCTVSSAPLTISSVGPVPSLTLPTCISNTPGSTADITINNYPGTGTYTLTWVNIGSSAYTNFLSDGIAYTPTLISGSWVLKVPVKTTCGTGTQGVYNITYNNTSCGSTGVSVNTVTLGTAAPFTVSYNSSTHVLQASQSSGTYTWYNCSNSNTLLTNSNPPATSYMQTLFTPSSGTNYYFVGQKTVSGCTYRSGLNVANYLARPTTAETNTIPTITVYQNISKGDFIVNIDKVNKTAPAVLYDGAGRLIRKTAFVKGSNNLNVTGLAAGVYHLMININGQSFTKKIMIQQ